MLALAWQPNVNPAIAADLTQGQGRSNIVIPEPAAGLVLATSLIAWAGGASRQVRRRS
jgi:hypothetical protein